MNKCTGIMGSIFGHKWERASFITFDLGKAGKRLIPVFTFPVDDTKFNAKNLDYLMPGDHICQRCGAVTGEKK